MKAGTNKKILIFKSHHDTFYFSVNTVQEKVKAYETIFKTSEAMQYYYSLSKGYLEDFKSELEKMEAELKLLAKIPAARKSSRLKELEKQFKEEVTAKQTELKDLSRQSEHYYKAQTGSIQDLVMLVELRSEYPDEGFKIVRDYSI